MDVLSADWLALCRRVVAAQYTVFAKAPSSAERTVYEGVGEGGDRTLAIDRRCEEIVFTELDRLAAQGASFLAVSEERGEVSFGSGGEVRVVIDPIDGSLNARRTIPPHSLSVAVASGASMADVQFAFVFDFGAGEEFVARRGAGALLDGEPIAVAASGERLEIVGFEAAGPQHSPPALRVLEGKAYRLRVVGSIAITLAYVAAGRFDAMLSLRPCRSVDAAAAQLLVREAGGEVACGELPLSQAGLDLATRYPIAAARDAAALSLVRDAQQASEAAP